MSVGAGARGLVAAGVATVVGARVETPGLASVHDLPRQAVFYANHSSHLDVLTLWAVLPARLRERIRPIAARDYWGTGLRHLAATRLFHAHLVDRGGSGSPGASAGTSRRRHTDGGVSPGGGQLEGMTQVLDAGDSLVIFPEGTRGDGEHLARFHGGLYHLARHDPGVAVVPVALGNLGRMLPKGEFLPVPHLSTVTFLPPLRLGADEERDAFLTRARDTLLAAIDPTTTDPAATDPTTTDPATTDPAAIDGEDAS